MNRVRSWVSDPIQLKAALELARTSTEPLWDLASASHELIVRKRFRDTLGIFDVIIERKSLELYAYCNALWVVQHDNTGLPKDAERQRRYLEACAPHASMNPAIHLNSSGVWMELGEPDRAVDQLLQASRRRVPIAESLDCALLLPLRAHARWAELERAAQPVAHFDSFLGRPGLVAPKRNEYGEYDAFHLAAIAPQQVVEALLLALDDTDPRVAHGAARQLMWWRDENGDDGHGGGPPEWLAEWYAAIGLEITTRVPSARYLAAIERDLAGDFAHEAARSLDILVRTYDEGLAEALEVLGPHLARCVRADDDYVKEQLIDALSHTSWQPLAQPVIRKYALEPLRDLVERIANGDSISDVAKVTRDQLRTAVQVLEQILTDKLGAHARRASGSGSTASRPTVANSTRVSFA